MLPSLLAGSQFGSYSWTFTHPCRRLSTLPHPCGLMFMGCALSLSPGCLLGLPFTDSYPSLGMAIYSASCVWTLLHLCQLHSTQSYAHGLPSLCRGLVIQLQVLGLYSVSVGWLSPQPQVHGLLRL